ncbi:MAG: hypothetical protein GY762_06040 [Proteobacteria bacterium]|nr:hypothetical protein [Pseudomonadota bacterium]
MKFRRGWVLLVYPFVMVSAVYIPYLAGRYHLGYWPRIYQDDPKYIEGFWMWTYEVSIWVVLLGAPLALLSSVCHVALTVIRGRTDRGKVVIEFVIGVLLLLLAIQFLRDDPHGVVEWFLD